MIGNDISDVKIGGYSTYYLKEDGTIWATGYNNYGQLGIGNTTNKSNFTQVIFEDGTPVKAKYLSAGSRNMNFIGIDGFVYATGCNVDGQLSNGDKISSLYPIRMKYADKSEINDAIQIAAGDSYYKNIASNITIIKMMVLYGYQEKMMMVK